MITPEHLERFNEIIDNCKALVEQVPAEPEKSFEYVLLQLYGKTLLTLCEISALLESGYPEGAMALARNTYENLVVMTYLCKNAEDTGLIQRFFDDYRIKTCKDHIQYLKWNIEVGNDTPLIRELLELRQAEYNDLLEQYQDFTRIRYEKPYFDHYWWVGKPTSFNRLCEQAGFDDNFFYNLSCYRVHAGITGSMVRFGEQADRPLIGPTRAGKEMPLYFSLLNLITQTRIFCAYNELDCSYINGLFEDLNRDLIEAFESLNE